MTTHDPGASAPTPALYTPMQAAAYLGISRSSVYELMNSGRLGSVRILRSRRIPVTELQRLVAEGSE